MATFVDVLLGTDGLRDWALLPDGTKYMLGTTSVSKLVAELAPTGEARRALEAFLAGDKARIRVDVDRFFALLAPTRTRFGSSTDPLIYQGDRTSQPREGSTMADIDQAKKVALQQWAAHLEQHIALLNQHAKEASLGNASATALLKGGVQKLGTIATWAERSFGAAKQAAEQQVAEEQAKQAAEQQVAEEQAKKQAAEQQVAEEQAEQAKKQASTSKMSFDAFKANTALVDQTLRTLDATNGKIDRLVAAGKRFNAAKAKGDLTKIASRVSEICASVDLANTWLKDDLQALSKSASEIAALFPADA
jgi:Sec-independent protein translocase protein TatA